MKKIFVLGIIFSMLCAMGVSALVTQEDYDESFSDVALDTAQSVSVTGGDVQYRGLNSIIANETFKLEVNETVTIANATNITLDFASLIASEIVVYNTTSDSVIDAANYTYDENTASIYFDVQDALGLDGADAKVSYNKTYTVGVTALESILYSEQNVNGAYGATGSFTLSEPTALDTTLGGKDWNTTYSIYRNDAVVSCGSTQATIYAAFGLLALVIIVGAGWLLVSMFQGGGFDGNTIIVTVIGFIALAITILVGFIITNRVAASICS